MVLLGKPSICQYFLTVSCCYSTFLNSPLFRASPGNLKASYPPPCRAFLVPISYSHKRGILDLLNKFVTDA